LVTVAGFSSGAKNAHNLHIAMSVTFKGAGLFNDGVYLNTFENRIIEDGKTAGEIELLKRAAVDRAWPKI
jgi:hypothetical protein